MCGLILVRPSGNVRATHSVLGVRCRVSRWGAAAVPHQRAGRPAINASRRRPDLTLARQPE